MINIAVIGLNFKSADISIREQVAFTQSEKIKISQQLLENCVDEVVILSTCNRSEIYISSDKIDSATQLVTDVFVSYANDETIVDHLFFKFDINACRHLFHVAAGLDSVVIGEDQILNQVRLSYEASRMLGTTKKVLNRLFQSGIEAAKFVKSQTRISEYSLSISRMAVSFLKKDLGSLKGLRVLLIGTGQMGTLALNYLLAEKVSHVFWASRNHEKKLHLVKNRERVRMIEYSQRFEFMEMVDLTISATGASHFIIKEEDVPIFSSPKVFMDLALPRDIEPTLVFRDNITLYNIDELIKTRDNNELLRLELADSAMILLEERVTVFVKWLDSAEVDHAIASLKELCATINEDSMLYLKKKTDLSERQYKLIESVLSHALSRVVRAPILTLKQEMNDQEREHRLNIVKNLFELNKKEC